MHFFQLSLVAVITRPLANQCRIKPGGIHLGEDEGRLLLALMAMHHLPHVPGMAKVAQLLLLLEHASPKEGPRQAVTPSSCPPRATSIHIKSLNADGSNDWGMDVPPVTGMPEVKGFRAFITPFCLPLKFN